MLRKREQPSAQPAVPPAVVGQGPGPELDVLASVLRALAQTAGPRAGVAADLEAWARHVLVLAPPPGRGTWSPTRDWPGLRRYVVAHIREARATSDQAIGDLQDVLWTLIEGMSRALADGATQDARAAECLARLRAAADAPPDELKRAALETVEQLGEIIEEKSSRQRELAVALGQRVDGLRLELAEARREAELDGLTQLGNRVMFDRELARAFQLHTLTGEPYALLLADVDGFKLVNDRFGHPVGDEALRSVADTLARSFPRRSDVVCRYGGDEFAVILRDADAADAERLAERLLEAVRALNVDGLAALAMTVSIGLAAADEADSAAGWLERADTALYHAKGAGRDRSASAADAADARAA